MSTFALALGTLFGKRRRKKKLSLKAAVALGTTLACATFFTVGCDSSGPSFCDVHNAMPRFVCETNCPCGNPQHNIDLSQQDDPNCPMLSLRNPENQMNAGPLGQNLHQEVQSAGMQLPTSPQSLLASPASDDGSSNNTLAKVATGDATSTAGGTGSSRSASGESNAMAGGFLPTALKHQVASAFNLPGAGGAAFGHDGPSAKNGASAGNTGGAADSGFLPLGNESAAADTAASAAGAAAKQGAPGANGFESSVSGGGGGRSISSTGDVGLSGNGVETKGLDAYLGSTSPSASLFDVVSKRYESWGSEMKTRKLKHHANKPIAQ